MNWTEDTISKLRAMRADGKSWRVVGKELGVSKSSAADKGAEIGLITERVDDRPLIEARIRAGETAASIARELHVAHDRVLSIRYAIGLPRQSRGGNVYSADMEANFRKWWIEGYSVLEIARRLGVTKGSVTSKKRRMRLEDRPSPLGNPRPKVVVRTTASVIDIPVREVSKPPRRTRFMAPAKHLFPTNAAIAEFIATRGVTLCPTAAVAETTASMPSEDRMVLATHIQQLEDYTREKLAPRQAKASEAARRFDRRNNRRKAA